MTTDTAPSVAQTKGLSTDFTKAICSAVTFDTLEKTIKMMFKKSGGKAIVALNRHVNGISARITIPSKASASEYYLTRESDRWWIYADERLDNIDPLSIDDEATACNIFLGIIEKYAVDGR